MFELKESEEEIVREMCEMIEKKKNCIPADELDGVIMGMHLNILEYIDENDQEELKEMIDLQATEQGIIQSLIDHGKKLGFDDGMNKGMDNGKREIIFNLLANHPLSEVARRLEMGEDEIIRIIQK